MGWFTKSGDSGGTAKDADALRTALLLLLRDIAGELPRAESRRLMELLERLQTYPTPSGLDRQVEKVLRALHGTAVGSGSADFADAAAALVEAMQRVSIHDADLTGAIKQLKDGVPSRVRNSDARQIESLAKGLLKTAEAARFKMRQQDEAAISLLGAMEAHLGQGLSATSAFEAQMADLLGRLRSSSDPDTIVELRNEMVVLLEGVQTGLGTARTQMDRTVARLRDMNRNIRGRSGKAQPTKGGGAVDSLTNLKDRGAFLDALPMALVAAREANGLLTVMRLNIDHMERINEVYHRSSGDDVIRTISKLVVQLLRTEDFVARTGGDSFAALLPNAGPRESTRAAKRLGSKIRKLMFAHDQQNFSVTVSVGMATWDGAESADRLYARADEALVQAKSKGGDRYWSAHTLQS